jgi:SAM-dependent methyltransferase
VTDPGARERTRAFFGPRAATWDERFPDDGEAFTAAVAELDLRPGSVALDVGCGTGRALPFLSALVSPAGLAFGLDVTGEMCAIAAGRAPVVLADAVVLPLPAGSCDAVFAAGLLNHLADPIAGLAELARVTRIGGRLALFHPLGRTALARRHGHDLDPDDIRDPANLRSALTETSWELRLVDDGADRYLAIATRR